MRLISQCPLHVAIILALGSVVVICLNSPTASSDVLITRGSLFHNLWEQLLRNIVRTPHPPTHIQTVWPECVHREISPHSFPRGSLFTYSQSVHKLPRPVRSRKAGRGRRGQADLYLLYPYLNLLYLNLYICPHQMYSGQGRRRWGRHATASCGQPPCKT